MYIFYSKCKYIYVKKNGSVARKGDLKEFPVNAISSQLDLRTDESWEINVYYNTGKEYFSSLMVEFLIITSDKCL